MSDDKDYAHMRDPEAQRTRYELWAIIIIVVVVVAGALVWRSVEHKPAGPQKDYNAKAYSANSEAAVGAGVQSTVLAPAPAPRPPGP
jgi:hypothetical protein